MQKSYTERFKDDIDEILEVLSSGEKGLKALSQKYFVCFKWAERCILKHIFKEEREEERIQALNKLILGDEKHKDFEYFDILRKYTRYSNTTAEFFKMYKVTPTQRRFCEEYRDKIPMMIEIRKKVIECYGPNLPRHFEMPKLNSYV